ncbi:MAG: drug/metabolite transporter (DMT)-like permease, partial [Patiriisocius sp.]
PATLSINGFWLAVSSGVVTSAFGYAIWYVALPSLSRVQAGVVQLLVPIIAAVGGVIWVGEAITLPLIIAQIMVLGGIAMVMIKARPGAINKPQ